MEKRTLVQYIDAGEIIRETDEDIRKLQMEQKEVREKIFKASGTDERALLEEELESLKSRTVLLDTRKEGAAGICEHVEQWMNTIPHRMQRIIRYKIFENMTWGQVAIRMGRGATPDGIRKEYENFMKAT